jgi:peptide/nickel transport system substrate-binding protein
VFLDPGGVIVPALGDVRVRQALNYAVNRTLISRALCPPASRPTSLAFVHGVGDDPKYMNYYGYDPAKAKALLAAAGYSSGFTFQTYTFGPWSGAFNMEPLALAMAKDFAAVGVTMQLDPATSNPSGTQSASSTGFVEENPNFTTWQSYGIYLKKDAPLGFHRGFHDPVLDRLFLRAQRLSKTAAAPLWRQFNDRLVTQAYSVPICTWANYAFASKKVGGVVPDPASYGVSSVKDWYPTGK